MHCRFSLLRYLLLPCIVVFPLLAQAAPILLVKPSGSDAAILETFNRLRGELHVHGFPVLLVENANEARAGAPDLASLTEFHGALAGVYLVRGSKPARAEIWIAGRGAGQSGTHAVLTSVEKDAPLLLAIRVVDLLRTNLREPTEDHASASGMNDARPGLGSAEIAPSGRVEKTDRPSRPAGPITGEKGGNSPSPPTAQASPQAAVAPKSAPVSPPVEKAPSQELVSDQPAERGTPPTEIRDTHRPPTAPDEAAPASPVGAFRFSLSGGLVASFDYRLGVGLGPGVSAHYGASRLWGLSLGFIGPVLGQTYEGTNITARVRKELLFLLVTLSAWRHGRIAQNVFIGPGAMHIAVQGEAQQPLAGRGSATWVGLAQAGTGISYQVFSRLSIELSASALLLVPQPTIEIAESRHPMSDPQFLSCLALHLGL